MKKVIILNVFFLSSCINIVLVKEKLFFKKLSFYSENFENKINFERYWSNDSQNTDKKKYSLENDYLKLTTAKGTKERVKIIFNKNNLTFGTYEWKVFVPKMKMNENCSIGAFLYADDGHELDFEIGSGSFLDREKTAAKDNELLLFCSSQQNPYSSQVVNIQEASWYTLKIELKKGTKKDYFAVWYLNDVKIHKLQLNYGKRYKFEALCSLENIHFIGDKPTSVDNAVFFDFFKYSSLK